MILMCNFYTKQHIFYLYPLYIVEFQGVKISNYCYLLKNHKVYQYYLKLKSTQANELPITIRHEYLQNDNMTKS